MISDSTKQMEFRIKVSPHLDVLLKLSHTLTRNGRDAIRLLREAIAEASPSWEQWLPEINVNIRLYEVVTRRYFTGFQQTASPARDRILGNGSSNGNHNGNGAVSEDSEELVNFFKSIVALPASLRTAMMLSYIEGFSTVEIADLLSVKPQSIDQLLNRGCMLLREEIYFLLVGQNTLGATANDTRPEFSRTGL